MVSAASDSEDRTEEAHEPRECMPCRGSGKLISNLGGSPSTVDCPWCDGGGVRLPGVDAQAHWSGPSAESGASAEADSVTPEAPADD